MKTNKIVFLVSVGIIFWVVIVMSIFLIVTSGKKTNGNNGNKNVVEIAKNDSVSDSAESDDSTSKASTSLITKDISNSKMKSNSFGSTSSDYLTLVPPEKRYALLIGVNKYKDSRIRPLASCVKDMSDLKDVLVKYAKFKPENITLMTDDSTGNLFPTAENIRKKVVALKFGIPKDALLIVAFSCHGTVIDMQDGTSAKSYLCVYDTGFTDIDSYIDRSWLFKTIDECQAEKKLLFCDACRSLTTKAQLTAISGMTPDGKAIQFKKMETPSKASWSYNFILMSSCSEGQTSLDAGVNGLFISFLLEGIRTGGAALQDGDLTASSWFDYAYKKTVLVSRQRFADDPNAGLIDQKEQTPRINIPAEAPSFIIAKLERSTLNIVLPDDPNQIRVQTYTINDLDDIKISDVKPAPSKPIKSDKIQLPPIPEEISKQIAVIRGIVQAAEELKNGTHPVLDKPKAVLAQAKLQYDSIRAKRDDMWQKLSGYTRTSLESKIAQDPNASPTTLDYLRPNDVGYSEFIKMVVLGKKTEQAKKVLEKVQEDIETALTKKAKSMIEEINDCIKKMEEPINAFREKVLLSFLEKCDGYDDVSVNDISDEGVLYLTDVIPALLNYDLGWDEKLLWAEAKTIWKERRPCIIERKRAEERAEQERITRERAKQERLERERAEREKQERLSRERAEKERIARERAEKERFAKEKENAGKRAVLYINGVKFAFRYCPAGKFMMGSPKSEEGHVDNEIQHEVTLNKGFWMMETEVTVGMFEAFVKETGYCSEGNKPIGGRYLLEEYVSWRNPGFNQENNNPVVCVSWEDAVAFSKWLESKIGGKVQLPTEAQWEYACRADSTDAYAGNWIEMTWYHNNSGGTTNPVGTKKPNAWGLYDMHGNVWEWCSDLYQDSSNKGTFRFLRGGSWKDSIGECRSAYRAIRDPKVRYANIGFRCIREFDSSNNTTNQNKISNNNFQGINKSSLYAGKRLVKIINGVQFAFRYCPAGNFMMGSPKSEEGHVDNEIQHEVTLNKGFWMMETEVTVGMFEAFVKETGYCSEGNKPIGGRYLLEEYVSWRNPGFNQENNNPVVCVSWEDAVAFSKWLESKIGGKVQLPTEAQWEYACRADSTDAYAGNWIEMTWYHNNSGGTTNPVGTKKPNAWGLYDMHGNVWEWCSDLYQDSSNKGTFRFLRGGSWKDSIGECRSAYRAIRDPKVRYANIGFRCIREFKSSDNSRVNWNEKKNNNSHNSQVHNKNSATNTNIDESLNLLDPDSLLDLSDATLDLADATEEEITNSVIQEVTATINDARAQRSIDPIGAIQNLKNMRESVRRNADIESTTRNALVIQLDRTIIEIEKYMDYWAKKNAEAARRMAEEQDRKAKERGQYPY